MRLTVNKEELLKALNAAGKATAAKSALPVLLNVRMELSDAGLDIVGTNQEITIKATVPHMIGDTQIIRDARYGSCMVNAHLITECTRRFENADVSLEVFDDTILKIDDGKSSFKLNCLNAGEFPDIDLDKNETATFTVSSGAFTALVDKSAFAVATKTQHMALTCVRLESIEGRMTATATDSARLSRAEMQVESDVRFGANVPGKTLQDIVRLFEAESELTVSVGEKKILFEFGNLVVSSRLVPGDYPPVVSVIPKTFNHYLEINAGELVRAIDRARVVSGDTEPVVKLTMGETEVEVSARSDASGSSSEKISTFRFSGDGLTVSFNSQFVLDAIKAVGGEDVTFCFVGEMKPFALRNPKDDSAIEIITPMRTL